MLCSCVGGQFVIPVQWDGGCVEPNHAWTYLPFNDATKLVASWTVSLAAPVAAHCLLLFQQRRQRIADRAEAAGVGIVSTTLCMVVEDILVVTSP